MNFKKRAAFERERLSRMQLYIGEEMVERYEAGLISWGQMLRNLIMIGGSAAAAAAIMAATGDAMPQPPPSGGSGMPPFAFRPAFGPLVVSADDPAVRGEPVSFQNGHTLRGYLARPTAGHGPFPGVIVIHEANGLSEHTQDVARRVAKAGFVAFAPDLLSRWGITPDMPMEKIMGSLGNAQPQEILADLNAATHYLAGQPDLNGKLGVVGFCFGGGYSLNLAAVNPNLRAAVCYYGVTPQPASQMANTQAAILSHYAGRDDRVNATVPELEAVLNENGKTFEKYYYEGAVHAFNNDTVSIFFNEGAAVTAWQRTLGWFNQYLR